MLNLSVEAIQALPVDERRLFVLRDLVDTNEWNEHNYLIAYRGWPFDQAIAKAIAWLRGCAFIARTPGQSTPDALLVTARGHEALRQGLSLSGRPSGSTAASTPSWSRGPGGSSCSENTSRRCSLP